MAHSHNAAVMCINHQIGHIDTLTAIRFITAAFGQSAFTATGGIHFVGQVMEKILIANVPAYTKFHDEQSYIRIIITTPPPIASDYH